MRRSGYNAVSAVNATGAVSDATDSAVLECEAYGGVATFEFTPGTSESGYFYTCKSGRICTQIPYIDAVCVDAASGGAPPQCGPDEMSIPIPGTSPLQYTGCLPKPGGTGGGPPVCAHGSAAIPIPGTNPLQYTPCIPTTGGTGGTGGGGGGGGGIPSTPAACALSGGTYNAATKKCLPHQGEQTLNKEAAPSSNTGLIVGGLALAAGVLYLATRKK